MKALALSVMHIKIGHNWPSTFRRCQTRALPRDAIYMYTLQTFDDNDSHHNAFLIHLSRDLNSSDKDYRVAKAKCKTSKSKQI